jgi:hypothetical protein
MNKSYLALFITSFILSISLIAHLVSYSLSPAWGAVTIVDPAGDAFDGSTTTDFTGMTISETADLIIFQLDFIELSQGLFGSLLMDLDGNRRTHGQVPGYLTEARIEFTVAILGICTAQFFAPGNASNFLNCWVDRNRFYVQLPKYLLPQGSANLEVAGIVSSNFACSGRDRIPDHGFVNVKTAEIHIDNEGLNLNPLQLLTDPAGDAPSPVDFKGFEVEVRGEHLVFRCHYHHSIEPEAINNVSIGNIHLDVDGDILTGFMNAGEVFPTFGVDVHLNYKLYALFLGGNVEVAAKVSDRENPLPVEFGLGTYVSDSWFKRNGEQLECAIPLALLPPLSQDSIAYVTTMEPISGAVDVFPDQGGVRLNGQLRPFNKCESKEVAVLDPLGDSLAFGYDNDDFVKVTAGHCQEGILLTVEYSDLLTTGTATTFLHLDLDKNPATGEPTYNSSKNTKLGVEKTIAFQWSPDALDFSVLLFQGSSGGLIGGLKPTVTMNFYANRAYFTIPYRILDGHASIHLYAESKTNAGTYWVFCDEVPNQGVFAIPGNTQAIPALNLLLLN